MTQAFVLLELLNHMVLVAQEAKSRGHRIVALNHDPLRDSGPFAVPEGLIDELISIDSWSDGDLITKIVTDVHERYEVVGTYAAFEAVLPYEAALRELAETCPTTASATSWRCSTRPPYAASCAAWASPAWARPP